MDTNKVWVEIRERGTRRLIRIVYNPYMKPVREVLADWIVPAEIKTVYGVATG